MITSRFSRIAVAAAVAMALAVGHLPAAAAAPAIPTAAALPAATSPYRSMTPAQIIAAARAKDATGFAKRYAKLKTSTALVDVVKGTVSSDRVWTYVKLLAAMSTSTQVSTLVSKTKGKHFSITISKSGATSVKLLAGTGKPKLLSSGPTCWKAWMAWYAWFSASSALCWGAGAVNPGLGIVCALALGVISFTLIDFNKACMTPPAMLISAGVRRLSGE